LHIERFIRIHSRNLIRGENLFDTRVGLELRKHILDESGAAQNIDCLTDLVKNVFWKHGQYFLKASKEISASVSEKMDAEKLYAAVLKFKKAVLMLKTLNANARSVLEKTDIEAMHAMIQKLYELRPGQALSPIKWAIEKEPFLASS
jgi:hypothetical protein